MSVQLIVLGTRSPDSDDDYNAYLGVAGKLLFGAGGTIKAQYEKTSQLAGDEGPQQVLVMDFPDERSAAEVFDSDEYLSVVANRDRAFDRLSVIIAGAAG